MAGSGRRGREDFGKLLLRLAVGALLLLHGIFKLRHGVAWMGGPLHAAGLPTALSYGAYVGEIVAPVCLLLGFQTRIAALVTAFDMFMAVFLVGRHHLFSLNASGGWALELEGLYFFGSVALFFLGGGRYAVSSDSGA